MAAEEDSVSQRHLQQAVVGAAQDRLRLLDRIDLSSAGLLADLIRFGPTTSDPPSEVWAHSPHWKKQLGTVECNNGYKY